LISEDRVDKEDEVEFELAAAGRLVLYHVSVGRTDGIAFLNLLAPKRAGGIVRCEVIGG
jgi:hypothetical protein